MNSSRNFLDNFKGCTDAASDDDRTENFNLKSLEDILSEINNSDEDSPENISPSVYLQDDSSEKTNFTVRSSKIDIILDYNRIGIDELQQKSYEKAYQAFFLAYKMADKYNLVEEICGILYSFYRLFVNLNRWKDAKSTLEYLLRKSNAITYPKDVTVDHRKIYHDLIDLCQKCGNIYEAEKYSEKYAELKKMVKNTNKLLCLPLPYIMAVNKWWKEDLVALYKAWRKKYISEPLDTHYYCQKDSDHNRRLFHEYLFNRIRGDTQDEAYFLLNIVNQNLDAGHGSIYTKILEMCKQIFSNYHDHFGNSITYEYLYELESRNKRYLHLAKKYAKLQLKFAKKTKDQQTIDKAKYNVKRVKKMIREQEE